MNKDLLAIADLATQASIRANEHDWVEPYGSASFNAWRRLVDACGGNEEDAEQVEFILHEFGV